jgi:hypothetical protein
MLVHLDTDLGGDTDDACALALLLGQAGVEVAGITTVADRTGRRAGCARHCLRLAGRDGIPVIAGAGRSMTAQLRAADLPRLRAAGPLGELLARQGEAHGQDFQMTQLGRLHAGLPDDLLNVHYDPVACAVAVGWPGATVAEIRLQLVRDGELVRFRPGPPDGPWGC